MKKLGLATALLLAMTGAQAYQFEIQGQSEALDSNDENRDFNNYTVGGQATYYFKNVDASKGPLAEAAFVNQASNVSLGYNFANLDEVKSQNVGVKAEAYVPTPYTPAYASLSYSATDNDGKYGLNDEDEEEEMEESVNENKFTVKPKMGSLTKSSLTNKAKKMEATESSMMSKPVVGKGVKTGTAKFEYKEGKKMETKEASIEPKGRAKGVGMNLKPKKFEYKESEVEENWGSKKDEYKRKDGHKTGDVKGHYKDYEKEETKEAARTLSNGTRNYAMRKGLPKMKVKPNAALSEEVVRLREKNEEYRKALNVFREKLNEVAVFNSNLAYATRLFTEHTTTKQEKINILRRFDDVESLKESKSLYSSIKNELSNNNQSVVTESISKIEKSPASGSAQNLIESKTYENPQFLRMKDIMSKISK